MCTGSALVIVVGVGAVVLASSACSGESKLGEECDEIGKTEDVCESGSVCGKQTSGSVVCIKICTEQAQCGANEDCNGVDGTNVKGCRTKSGTSTGNADGGGGGDGGKK